MLLEKLNSFLPREVVFPLHMCFTPMMILFFCKEYARSLDNIMPFLDSYGAASGQSINNDKCFFYLGKHALQRESNIQSLLGFNRGKVHFTYLRVPIFNGRPRECHLQSLANKVRSKLEGWFGKLLSMAGHVQLVKSVVLCMLLHSFSVYKWPSSLICLLKKWTRNFIWTSSCNIKKLMIVSWDQVCCPKEEGGLGVRNFDYLNTVALYKCVWNMISTYTPWSSYFKNRFTISTCKVATKYKCSSIWFGLHFVFPQLLSDCRWIIGVGRSVIFGLIVGLTILLFP
ncbi:hypothetical protein Ddye_009172 [Dipteronia dyeriana]|uniref:Uncharacterized protein n=1 Tax=Dipteronia dyeriana TaxID=168575 RepID=A0AAD9XB49_9ROSI|nr:hypothetical protein Ddye_009172 [Dipteronia dyeriana]